MGGTAVTAPDCPLHVFFSFFGPSPSNTWEKYKKTGPDSQCKKSDHLFVETSHSLNVSHQYPQWGIIYPPQHTFEVLLILHSTQFKCSSILHKSSSVLGSMNNPFSLFFPLLSPYFLHSPIRGQHTLKTLPGYSPPAHI